MAEAHPQGFGVDYNACDNQTSPPLGGVEREVHETRNADYNQEEDYSTVRQYRDCEDGGEEGCEGQEEGDGEKLDYGEGEEETYFNDDDYDDEYDDEDTLSAPSRHPYLPPPYFYGMNAFAPPFYNRPPTPLPPSPSLTSLLRPAFSAGTSRPTTPDSSDDVDTTNDTEAAVAKSARHATRVPRASPKVPTYEYYGFVLYLTSNLAFLIYLLWSYLPSPFLHQLGIYYYPNRWWSLAIPAYLVMTVVYIYVALAAYNTGYLTLPMNSIENLVDDASNIAVIDSKGRRRPGGSAKVNPGSVTWVTMGQGQGQGTGGVKGKKVEWENIWSEGTDAVMDIPIGGVCEVLYGGDAEDSEEEDGVE
ncbi:hypothetical protein KEM55_003617 [Ascosphaera atra]|nr:hypothetical protein KEM55_003617 [Ascosphaera atra]